MSSNPTTYAPGDRVRLIDGPLSNFEAVVQTVETDPVRLHLAVAVKQMSVLVLVEAHQVQQIE